jgi:hypothetical protein
MAVEANEVFADYTDMKKALAKIPHQGGKKALGVIQTHLESLIGADGAQGVRTKKGFSSKLREKLPSSVSDTTVKQLSGMKEVVDFVVNTSNRFKGLSRYSHAIGIKNADNQQAIRERKKQRDAKKAATEDSQGFIEMKQASDGTYQQETTDWVNISSDQKKLMRQKSLNNLGTYLESYKEAGPEAQKIMQSSALEMASELGFSRTGDKKGNPMPQIAEFLKSQMAQMSSTETGGEQTADEQSKNVQEALSHVFEKQEKEK